MRYYPGSGYYYPDEERGPEIKTMKALSIRQPWAHLIIYEGKDVENRTWPTNYRGPLIIHTGLLRDEDAIKNFAMDDFPLPLGGVIGRVMLVDCVQGCSSRWAMPYTNIWHWILDDPVPCVFRRCPGRQGLFEIKEELCRTL